MVLCRGKTPLGLGTPDGENGYNYAGRFEGWLLPPVDGNYKFWIAADDQAELWLSSSENPGGAVRISRETSWTGEDAWGSTAIEPSAMIPLKAGRAYYFFALWSEGGGGDNCSVGFQCAEAGVTTTMRIPMSYVSNTYPVDLVHPFSDVGPVEYDLWDVNTDIYTALGFTGGVMPDYTKFPAPTKKGLLKTFMIAPEMQNDPLQGTAGQSTDAQDGANLNNYAYRQYGIIKVDAADAYEFGTNSNEGSKLYIGNWWEGGKLTLVVNNDGSHGRRWRYGAIELTPGYVGIVVEFYERTGNEYLQVNYRSSTIPWQWIPTNALYSRTMASAAYPHNLYDVPTNAVLTWSKPITKPGVTNRVYFGEAGTTLAKVDESAATSYTPTLVANKAYQWRVDIAEPNTQGPNPIITTGLTWGFMTLNQPVEKKMVAHWPLDSNLADATGNLIPGTYYSTDNKDPNFEPGIKGSALAVNIANTGKNQYARLSQFAVGFSPTGIGVDSARTVACWAKNAVPASTIGDWCTVFGYSGTQGTNELHFDLEKTWSNWYVIHRYGGEYGIGAVDDQWHLIVATYEPAPKRWTSAYPGITAPGTVKTYYDGALINTATTYLSTEDIVQIGKRAAETALWRGWVDDARIYNYALPASDITALYWDVKPGACIPGPALPYDFNRNCKVDIDDFAMFSTQWLRDNMVP